MTKYILNGSKRYVNLYLSCSGEYVFDVTREGEQLCVNAKGAELRALAEAILELVPEPVQFPKGWEDAKIGDKISFVYVGEKATTNYPYTKVSNTHYQTKNGYKYNTANTNLSLEVFVEPKLSARDWIKTLKPGTKFQSVSDNYYRYLALNDTTVFSFASNSVIELKAFFGFADKYELV